MRRVLIIAALCFFGVSARSVNAWNDVGHMVVARIAYERLADAEKMAVVSILRHHPHLHELLLKNRPAHASEDEWIFLTAATWPDQVRPPRTATHEPVKSHPIYRFHHATWHYANFEYRTAQRQVSLPIRPMVEASLPPNSPEHTNIVEQLDHSYLILRGAEREQSVPETELDPSEIRAVRLCWLFHLMGDIHQPLHVINLVDDRIPHLQHGDDGGNKLAVRLNHGTAPKKLHAIWDDLFGNHAQYDKVVQIAEMFSRDPHFNSTNLPEFSSHKLAREFAEEGYQIAKDSIYLNGKLHYALWSRVESHELAEEDVPVLPQQVFHQAQSLAQRRIVLAGYRLAERLKFIISRDSNLRGFTNSALRPLRVQSSSSTGR